MSKVNYLFDWSELDSYGTILDKEWAWLSQETGLNAQLHDLRYAFLEKFGYTSNEEFLNAQPGSPSVITDYYADAASLGFQVLSPRLDGTISTSPQRGAGSATFTRNDSANNGVYTRDFENNYRRVRSNEARFQGARRVENLLWYTEDFSHAPSSGNYEGWTKTSATVSSGATAPDGSDTAWTLTATGASGFIRQDADLDALKIKASGTGGEVSITNSIWIKRRTGTGSVSLYTPDINGATITVTDEWKRFSRTGLSRAGDNITTLLVLLATDGDEVDIWHPQIEDVSGQTNQAPSEYVSRDVGFGDDYLEGDGYNLNASAWTEAASPSGITYGSDGSASWDGSQSVSSYLFQALTGIPYNQWNWFVRFTVSNYSAGNAVALLGGVSTSNVSANGVYELAINNPANVNFNIGGDASFVGTISDVTLVRRTKGIKYFYTENQNEVTENRILYSRDFDNWSATNSPVLTQNQVGFDGQPNMAWTLEDDSASVYKSVSRVVAIDDNSLPMAVSYYIKKSDDETSFPEFQANLSGGTAVTNAVQINKKTGDTTARVATGTVSHYVEDKGSWWKVTLISYNNGTGNTVLNSYIYPAVSTTFGTAETSATGSTVVDQVQVKFNASVATETQIETTTAAITNVVGTKTKQWEQQAQLIQDTEDFSGTGWSVTSSPIITTLHNGYHRLQDDGVAAHEIVKHDLVIANDSGWHYAQIDIKKDSSSRTSYPLIWLSMTGGTAQSAGISIDPASGTYLDFASSGARYVTVEDKVTFWRCKLALKNNSTGNTIISFQLYPGYSTAIGSGTSTANVGYIDVKDPQFYSDRLIGYDSIVRTYSGAITLGKEKELDKYLHPTKYNLGAKLFSRYDKWVASTAYAVGDKVIPDTGSGPAGGDGYYYECVVAGTSNSTEPTFNTTIGDGTYDNGVVWKCKGKATVAGYLSEPARTNSITYSYDLTNWAQTGTAVSALDETGIDGIANKATTLTDDNGAGYEYVSKTVTVANDGATHCGTLIIKKDSDTSRYVGCNFYLVGGTQQNCNYDLDTQNGTLVLRSGTGTYDAWVEDLGDWWVVHQVIDNNSSGNTVLYQEVFPAVGTVQGTGSAAATGSCIVGHAQVELNIATPSSPIETNGTIETRNADNLSYDVSNIDVSLGTALATWTPSNHINVWSALVGTDYNSGVINVYHVAHDDPITVGIRDETNLISITTGDARNRENLKAELLGSRWVAADGIMQVAKSNATSSAEGTYDGDPNITALNIVEHGNNNGGIISDVLIFNKDLGTTKLESLTEYN